MNSRFIWFWTALISLCRNIIFQKIALNCPQLFCSRDIMYAGQAIGVIIAESQELANRAAIKVNITYKNKQKPLLTVRDVLQANDVSRITLDRTIQPTVQLKNGKKNLLVLIFDVYSSGISVRLLWNGCEDKFCSQDYWKNGFRRLETKSLTGLSFSSASVELRVF